MGKITTWPCLQGAYVVNVHRICDDIYCSYWHPTMHLAAEPWEVYTCNPEIYLVLTYMTFSWHIVTNIYDIVSNCDMSCDHLYFIMWPFMLHHVTISYDHLYFTMWPYFFFMWSCILFHLFVFAVFNSLELTKMSLKSLPFLLFT